MMTVNCRNIRGEIDEADLNQELSNTAVEHLQLCTDCRSFHDDRGGLRNLMSSLGTVSAPADFDFRLRARLAREKDSPNGVFASGKFLIGARSAAAVALVLLLALVGGIVVRNRVSSSKGGGSVAAGGANARTLRPDAKPLTSVDSTPSQAGVTNGSAPVDYRGPAPTEEKQRRRVRVPENNREQTAGIVAENKSAVRERSENPATVVILNDRTDGGVVRVPIDGQSLRVSVDDGHGTARTISVPAVSFGSQRVGERGLSFAPIKSTKGVW
jgi:hypothetical protein